VLLILVFILALIGAYYGTTKDKPDEDDMLEVGGRDGELAVPLWRTAAV
jgi:hypothetical protein